jgi:hypothetical protein
VANIYPLNLFINDPLATICFTSQTISTISANTAIRCYLDNQVTQYYSDNIICSQVCFCRNFQSISTEDTYILKLENISYNLAIINLINRPELVMMNKNYILRDFDISFDVMGQNFKEGGRCVFTTSQKSIATTSMYKHKTNIVCETPKFDNNEAYVHLSYVLNDNTIPQEYSYKLDIVSIIVLTRDIVLFPDADNFELIGLFDGRVAYSVLVDNRFHTCNFKNLMTLVCNIGMRYLLYKEKYNAEVILDSITTWYNINLFNLNYVTIFQQDYKLISTRGDLKYRLNVSNVTNLEKLIKYRTKIYMYFIMTNVSVPLQYDDHEYFFISPNINIPSLYITEYFYICT